MEPVPKLLYHVKNVWAPGCAVISFKLETDPAMLLPKAAKSLMQYNVDAVIANQLERRYSEVHVVSRAPAGSAAAAASFAHPAAMGMGGKGGERAPRSTTCAEWLCTYGDIMQGKGQPRVDAAAAAAATGAGAGAAPPPPPPPPAKFASSNASHAPADAPVQVATIKTLSSTAGGGGVTAPHDALELALAQHVMRIHSQHIDAARGRGSAGR